MAAAPPKGATLTRPSGPPLPRLPPVPHAPARPPAPPSAFATALSAFWATSVRVAPHSTLLVCAGVGVAGGALLVGHRLGLGAAVVGLLLWAVAVPALVRRRAVGDLVTGVLAVVLVAVVAVRDAPWVVAVCLLAASGVGAVAATSARSAPAVLLSGVSWATGAVRAVPWVGRGLGQLAGTRRGQLLSALRSVAITVVLLVVFGLLFASADTVFASYVPDVDVDLLPGQVVVGALVALAAAAAVQLSLAPPGWSTLRPRPASPARRGEWLLPVAALDALVLAFVLVQVGALLGGHRHVLETAGLSYAEYARQGFAQLVVVTVLTLVVVALAARRAPRATARDRLVSRVALGVLCVGTLGVVGSALRRMDLYMEAFGLTRLRLFVAVVEVALAVVLVLVLVAGVRWRGAWLPRAVVQVLALSMVVLAALNPDATIARTNVAAAPGVDLDIAYLQGLSADAVPVLDGLDEPLRSCVLSGMSATSPDAFAGWNLGRARAAEVWDGGDATGGPGASACYDYSVQNPSADR